MGRRGGGRRQRDGSSNVRTRPGNKCKNRARNNALVRVFLGQCKEWGSVSKCKIRVRSSALVRVSLGQCKGWSSVRDFLGTGMGITVAALGTGGSPIINGWIALNSFGYLEIREVREA